MGLGSLNRLMSKRMKQKRRRQIQDRYGLVSSVPFNKNSLHQQYGSVPSVPFKKDSLCQEDDHSQGVETWAYSELNLPEDIWLHIHFLMPLCDSAHSACVSRTFLNCWRCHPNLIFTEESLGLEEQEGEMNDKSKHFISRVDHILNYHSGVGVKTLKLEILDHYDIDTFHLNYWLETAITPGIEEVILLLHTYDEAEYIFPCSVLLDGRGKSIRYLDLMKCVFRPTVGFHCLTSLTKLNLYDVHITGDELYCLISNSFGLEQLELRFCRELIFLKIPFCLERLSCLRVLECNQLQVIESKAPNLSIFFFFGDPVQLSFGESSQVNNLTVEFSFEPNCLIYAIKNFPSIVPHLETLVMTSTSERFNTPMVANKFLHLKYLKIDLFDDYDDDDPVFAAYDYLSLVSFLDASPVLETFILSVHMDEMKHDPILGDASHMRQIPERKHERLKEVQIYGFCTAKSMVELTWHILENATSLESLTLDSIFSDENAISCSDRKSGKCCRKSRHMMLEAHKALGIIKRYILGRVPSTVKLNVQEPCSRCHAIDVKLS